MSTYQTKHNTIAIMGGEPLFIRSLLNNQQFSDDDGLALARGISSAAWPLFGLLWPSSHVLAGEMMVRQVQGLRILEIGCGLGLASLVAHRRGADICASDAHPLVQAFLNENTRLNQLKNIDYSDGCWAQNYPKLGVFDLIVGSDVLYERDEKGVLAHFINRHANIHCEVLIIDPNRSNRSHFNRHMALLGFNLEVEVVDAMQADGVLYHGRALRYKR